MEETDPEDLRKAYRCEKDPRVRARMAVASMVCTLGDGVQDTADRLMQCPDRVTHWGRCSGEGGIDALRDLPRSRRPPKVGQERISGIIKNNRDGRVIPRRLRADIRESTGVRYHITSIRRIMKKIGMSPKVPQLVHTSRPDTGAIRGWQRKEADLTPEKGGFCHRGSGRVDLRLRPVEVAQVPVARRRAGHRPVRRAAV